MRSSSSRFILPVSARLITARTLSCWLAASLALGCSSVGDDQTNEQPDVHVRFPAIERTQALKDLTSDDMDVLCAWAHAVAPGGSESCLDESLIVSPGLSEHLCGRTLRDLRPDCSAKVQDFADCVATSPCEKVEREQACSGYEACQGASTEP